MTLVAAPNSRGLSGEFGLEDASLYLNVEKNSQLISGLGQRNFHLFVDGNPAPFRLEQPEQPASVAFLVEFGRSSGYYLDDLNAAIRSVLKHVPEGHYYAIATFAAVCDTARKDAACGGRRKRPSDLHRLPKHGSLQKLSDLCRGTEIRRHTKPPQK